MYVEINENTDKQTAIQRTDKKITLQKDRNTGRQATNYKFEQSGKQSSTER